MLKEKIKRHKKILLLVVIAAALFIWPGFPGWMVMFPPSDTVDIPVGNYREIGVLPAGAGAGNSTEPVSEEEGENYDLFFQTLRDQHYCLRPFPFHPAEGGIVVSSLRGCFPIYYVYWDGKVLWAPDRLFCGFAPSDPAAVDSCIAHIWEKRYPDRPY